MHHLIDVFAIADDHRQVPIVSWSVKETLSGSVLGKIRLASGRFRASTDMGLSSVHCSLTEARDAVAFSWSPDPGRVN